MIQLSNAFGLSQGQLVVGLVVYAAFLVVALFVVPKIARRYRKEPVAWIGVGLVWGVLGLVLMFIETRKAAREEAEAPKAASKEPLAVTAGQLSSHVVQTQATEWFYLDAEGKQAGPIGIDALKALWQDDTLKSSTYVWCRGMPEWQFVEKLPYLRSLLGIVEEKV